MDMLETPLKKEDEFSEFKKTISGLFKKDGGMFMTTVVQSLDENHRKIFKDLM